MNEPFIHDRGSSRRLFIETWQKHQAGNKLQALEKLIVEIIQAHPEFHEDLQKEDTVMERDYFPEEGRVNPFLHMGLHIAIREQVSINQPAGIREIYEKGLKKSLSAHDFEHKMMNCLGEALWNAQRNNKLPDEIYYLECLKQLL